MVAAVAAAAAEEEAGAAEGPTGAEGEAAGSAAEQQLLPAPEEMTPLRALVLLTGRRLKQASRSSARVKGTGTGMGTMQLLLRRADQSRPSRGPPAAAAAAVAAAAAAPLALTASRFCPQDEREAA